MKIKNLFFILCILNSWHILASEGAEQPPAAPAQIQSTTPLPIPLPPKLKLSPDGSSFPSPASHSVSPSSMIPINAGINTPPPTPENGTKQPSQTRSSTRAISSQDRSARIAQLRSELEAKIRAELEPTIRAEINAREAKARIELITKVRNDVELKLRKQYETHMRKSQFQDMAFAATFGALAGAGLYAWFTSEGSEKNKD